MNAGDHVTSEPVPFFTESATCRLLDGGVEVTDQPLVFDVSHRAGWASFSMVASDTTLEVDYQSEAHAVGGSITYARTQTVRYPNQDRGSSAFVLDILEGSQRPMFLNVDFQHHGEGPPHGVSNRAGGFREVRFSTWSGCLGELVPGPGNYCLSDSPDDDPCPGHQPGVYRWPLPLGTTQVVFSVFGYTNSREQAPFSSTLSASVEVWVSHE